MATTPAGATLTEQHRQMQLALRALTIRQIMALWPAFDPEDMDRTWPPLFQALAMLIRLRGRDSAAITSRYYQRFRQVEGVPGQYLPKMAADAAAEQVARSLGYVGPVQTQKLLDLGRTDVREQAFVNVQGATTRLVLDQGRRTLIDNVKADPQALGYMRVSDGDPCAWCSMLISRGPIYTKETAFFEAHDSCGCSAEGVFDRKTQWTDDAKRFRELWDASTEGLSGQRAINAFRRAIEQGKTPMTASAE